MKKRSWIWQLHERCNYSLCRYNVKLCGRRTWMLVFFDLLTNFFDKWFWAGVIIICWFLVAHKQICNCQRLFVVYGEFLGKPNVQGQLRMLLSLFFVYTAIYMLNVLQKCCYTFKKNNYADDKFKIIFKYLNFYSICSYLSQNHRQTQVKTFWLWESTSSERATTLEFWVNLRSCWFTRTWEKTVYRM